MLKLFNKINFNVILIFCYNKLSINVINYDNKLFICLGWCQAVEHLTIKELFDFCFNNFSLCNNLCISGDQLIIFL